MGRDQRRRKLAGPIADEGELVRTLWAGECALFHLHQHQRIRDRYLAWWKARALTELLSIPESAFGDEATVVAAMEAGLAAARRPPTPAEWDAVAHILEGWGVPCWRWAASRLVKDIFPHQAYNDINLTRPKLLRLERAGLVPLPRGHLPQDKASAILRRHAAWWYLHTIEGASIQHLEREDARAHPEISRGSTDGSPSRSRVYDGIESFENLLKRLLDDDE